MKISHRAVKFVPDEISVSRLTTRRPTKPPRVQRVGNKRGSRMNVEEVLWEDMWERGEQAT